MTAALYLRVSTLEQDYQFQRQDLLAYATRMGWETVEYAEKESSVKVRPIFNRMIEDAKQGKIAVILVWRIDRFARSMKDFVLTTLALHQHKVRLISVTENVDTGDENPFAEFQRGLLALLSQLERKIIVARVKAGIQYAKEHGTKSGKPPGRQWLILPKQAIRDFRATGATISEVQAKFGLSRGTVARIVRGGEG